MRKLDTKNKVYITGLLILTAVVIGAIVIFIVTRFMEMNVRYDVVAGSISFNSDSELVTTTSDTYIKKDFLSNYYMVIDNENVYLEKSPVVYDKTTGNMSLYGTFYEITSNGNVDKLTNYNTLNVNDSSRIFKIDDRKYLVVSSSISSEDGSLKTNNFLLINIDKVGNAYIYNNSVNMKTFNEFKIVTDKFVFNVNEEKLIMDNETIDLSKINGSTNTYKAKESSNETDNNTTNETTNEINNGTGNGTGEGNGSGDGTGNGTGNTTEESEKSNKDEVQDGKEAYYIEEDMVNKYVKKKTTILGGSTTETEITVNYIVYDPYEEYKSLYLKVYDINGLLVNTIDMNKEASSITISDLKIDSQYRVEFHYTFLNTEGKIEDVIFDTVNYTTKKINATITLEKVTQSVVLFNVKIDTNSDISSESSNAKVVMYINDIYAAEVQIDVTEAVSSKGYSGQISYSEEGFDMSNLYNYATLKLENCIYSGVTINSTYKYVM